MAQRLTDLLVDKLERSFPPNQSYSRSDLERDEMEPVIGRFLQSRLTEQVEKQFAEFPSGTPWYDATDAKVIAAREAHLASLVEHGLFPSDEWDLEIRRAVDWVVGYLVEPAVVGPRFVFENLHSTDAQADHVLSRLGHFSEYAYLHRAAESHFERTDGAPISRDRLGKLLRIVDQRLPESFSPRDWLALLAPLDSMFQRVTSRSFAGLPASMLATFFAAKGREDIEARVKTYHSVHGRSHLSHTDLEFVLSAAGPPTVVAAGGVSRQPEATQSSMFDERPEQPKVADPLHELETDRRPAVTAQEPQPVRTDADRQVEPLEEEATDNAMIHSTEEIEIGADEAVAPEEMVSELIDEAVDLPDLPAMDAPDKSESSPPHAVEPELVLPSRILNDEESVEAMEALDDQVTYAVDGAEEESLLDIEEIEVDETDEIEALIGNGIEALDDKGTETLRDAEIEAPDAKGIEAINDGVAIDGVDEEVAEDIQDVVAATPDQQTFEPQDADTRTPARQQHIAPAPYNPNSINERKARTNGDDSEPIWRQYQDRFAAPQKREDAAIELTRDTSAPSADERPRSHADMQDKPRLWEQFQSRAAGLEPPAKAIDGLEHAVLGAIEAAARDDFIVELFGGSRERYSRVLQRLSVATDWPTASRIIAEDVFREHRVNIYGPNAIAFTNAAESRFRHKSTL